MSIEGEISGDYDEGSNFSEESLSQAGSDYSPEFEDKKEHKAKYQVITEQKRQRLIDCVEQRKISISKVFLLLDRVIDHIPGCETSRH